MKITVIKMCFATFITSVAALLNAQGNPRLIDFTSDAATEISTNKAYTHAVNFGAASGTLEINGVTFANSTANNNTSQYGWRNFPPKATSNNHQHINTPSANKIHTLLQSLNWDLPSGGTMVVTGLEPGTPYEIRFYNRAWTPGDNRSQIITFKPDAATADIFPFNPDAKKVDQVIAYRYIASDSRELEITIDRNNPGNGSSLHIYGFSNEQLVDVLPLPVSSLGDTFATLNGRLFTTGLDTAITVRLKLDDGDNSDAAWLGATPFALPGVFDADGPIAFAIPAGTLAASTSYAFRFVLANNAGTTCTQPQTFTTHGTAPVVVSLAADAVTSISAMAKASVEYIAPGVASGAIVELFWGENDGEDVASAWGNPPVVIGSTHGLGAVAHTLNGLANGTKYFYRHRIGNGSETAWAPESASFTTVGMPAFGDSIVAPYSESVYFGIKLGEAGIAAKTVTLFFGEDAANLAPVKSCGAAPSDKHFAHIIKGLVNDQDYYYSARVETAMPDAPGAPRVIETPVASVRIAANNLIASEVSWTGAGGDWKWGNPLNWNTGKLPGPYNRVRFSTASMAGSDNNRILVDGPHVVGDIMLNSGDTRVTFAADAPDASITLLSGNAYGGKEKIFDVDIFIGNSGSWQGDSNAYTSPVRSNRLVHDHGLGLDITSIGNQNNESIIAGPVDIGGKIVAQNRNLYLNTAFTLTNAAGAYLDSRMNDGGNETTMNMQNATPPLSNRVSPGIALGSLRSGGRFTLNGSAEMDIAEEFTLLDLQSGRLGVTVAGVSGSAYATTLAFGGIQRGEGACLLLSASNGGRVVVSNAVNSNGIWQPWAFRDTHYTRVGADGSIIRVPDTDYIAFTGAGANPGDHYKTTQPQISLAAPAEVRGLRVHASGSPTTLDLGAHNLTINSGALTADNGPDKIIQSSGGGALVFGGDDIVFASSDTGAKFVIDAPMEWLPPAANAPRPSLIVPTLGHESGLWLSGEDRVNDYGALTCNARYSGGGLSQLVFGGPSDRAFHGPVSGAMIITKRGPGTLRLNGESRIRQGNIQLWDGTLMVGNPSIPGIYLVNSNATLSVAADVVYGGMPEDSRMDPGVTLGGFGTFSAKVHGKHMKSGSRIAPGDADTIATLTFSGDFGNSDNSVDWLFNDLFYDIKLDGAAHDSVHVANRFRKPNPGSTWTFVVRDISDGKNSVTGKTYVLLDWTGNLENIGSEFDVEVAIHPSSARRIFADSKTKITFDPVAKQIVLTGLKSFTGGMIMVR